jgi:hypothetical protein
LHFVPETWHIEKVVASCILIDYDRKNDISFTPGVAMRSCSIGAICC